MWIGMAVTAGICLLYWLILFFYSGLTEGFMMFWLGAAIVLACASLWSWLRKHKKLSIQIPLWIRIPFQTTMGFLVAMFILSEVSMISDMVKTTPKSLDYLLVLGNYEYGEQKDKILTQRLDCALEYLKQNENTQVIVSGGNLDDLYVSQAKVMYDYLLLQGISSSRIIMEKRSEDTTQSIYYSRLLIEEGDSVGIVTSNYHSYRAVGIAQKAGISPVYSIIAPTDWILLPDMMVRECFIVLIEKLRGNL